MLLERTVLRESLVTMLTLKRPIFIVGPFMLFKPFFTIKEFVAIDNWTFKKHHENKLIIDTITSEYKGFYIQKDHDFYICIKINNFIIK